MIEKHTNHPLEIRTWIEELRYDDVVLFKDLEFVISGGHWTCLLGVSGVGKSTLLKLFAGLASGFSRAQFHCSDNIPLLGRVAYMGQNDLLFPWLTVIENVMIGDRLRRSSDGVRLGNAYELLDLVGLRTYASELPAKLSGGMRQRAALVRTLLEDKPLVVMDEPFSALDVITRLKLQDLAAGLLKKKTVFLVTHDPLEALRLGKTVYLMTDRPAKLERIADLTGDTPRDTSDQLIIDHHFKILARMQSEAA